MIIGYFADGPWAHHAFRTLIQNKEIQIAFICVRNDSGDKVLEEYARQYSIDLIRHPNINSDDFLELVSKYQCDLFVSMSFNQIFRKRIINYPQLGIINCHAGKLPFYRGRNILNWALINDEKEFGITVHYVDEGTDTGDIILQKCYPISDNDNYQSLLEIAHTECASCLYEAILLIFNNKVTRIKQSEIHPVGFYCARRREGDEIINWNQSSRDIFNFIRAISNPGPVATTNIGEHIIKINKAELIENAPAYKGNAGQVIQKTQSFIIIKTVDTTIKITEWSSPVLIKTGDKLGQ